MIEIPQAALRARQMYAEGRTVRTIQAETGLNLDQLYHAPDGLPQPNGDSLLPPIPRRRIIARKTSRAATLVALVARLMRAAELKIYGLEQQLEKAGYVPAESERNSRATASLVRTMRELAAIDERDASRKVPNRSDESNDEPIRRKEHGKGGKDYWEEMKGTDAWQRSRRPSHSARISRRAFP
ncbi:MAG: hypothetical protein ABSF41_09965 [Pseudolabrys sp.]